jgi:tyrosyl-tRNA synthetase
MGTMGRRQAMGLEEGQQMSDALDTQVALLMQGAEFGDPQIGEAMAAELRQRLAEGRPLRVYCGYDATRPDLHLGHTITMRKLRQFQDLGHEATFLIGDFTTLVGDPSDKDGLRPQLSPDEIAENSRTYAEQAFQILDRGRTRVRYNSEWLGRLDLAALIQLAGNFTVQQLLARESFGQRVERGEPVWLHELFYAMLQGYDAVAMETDVQLGGTEQLFSLLAGRKLQEALGQRPQVCLTFPILVGTDGQARMSKSMGNYIGISEPPEVMYGKVMSLPDSAMGQYFRLVTRWTPAQVAEMEDGLAAGSLHPMEAKKRLAWEIVDSYHGAEAARTAARQFQRVHQQREVPEEVPSFALPKPVPIADLLVAAGLSHSKSAARRLVEQGGVSLDGEAVTEIGTVVAARGQVLRVGRRRFVRLVPA